MSIEEANQVLEELYAVRLELLNDKAIRLFEAIMTIRDDRDKGNDLIDKLIQEVTMQGAKIDKVVEYCHDKLDLYNNSKVDELGRHEYYYPPYIDDILKILKGENYEN